MFSTDRSGEAEWRSLTSRVKGSTEVLSIYQITFHDPRKLLSSRYNYSLQVLCNEILISDRTVLFWPLINSCTQTPLIDLLLMGF